MRFRTFSAPILAFVVSVSCGGGSTTSPSAPSALFAGHWETAPGAGFVSLDLVEAVAPGNLVNLPLTLTGRGTVVGYSTAVNCANVKVVGTYITRDSSVSIGFDVEQAPGAPGLCDFFGQPTKRLSNGTLSLGVFTRRNGQGPTLILTRSR